MKTRLLALLPMLVLLLPGCNPLAPDAPSDVIMPLAVGNMWIGNKITYDAQGNPLSAPDTLRVTRDMKSGSETMFDASDGETYINRADGMWREAGQCSCLRAKYPAKQGDMFNEETTKVLLPDELAPVDMKTAMLVVSTDTTVTVPAGTYRCYHYRPVIITPTAATFITAHDYFYAPNVGLVLVVARGQQGYRWELVRAEIG